MLNNDILPRDPEMAWYLRMTVKRLSFLLGIASLFDFFGVLSPIPKMNMSRYEPLYDDAEAIANDWEAIGNDMRTAMSEYDQARS
jgi:hypothetical protein